MNKHLHLTLIFAQSLVIFTSCTKSPTKTPNVTAKTASDVELTGKVHWHSSTGSVDGIWNPVNNAMEWKTTESGKVAGVWNPEAQVVEWQASQSGGVDGVWHPVAKKVEWHTSNSGNVAGVWNPEDQTVEWKPPGPAASMVFGTQ